MNSMKIVEKKIDNDKQTIRKEKNRYGFFLFTGATFLGFIVFIINLARCNIDTDWLSWLYYIPAAVGHASLFAFILYLLFYVPFSFIFKNYKVPAVIFIVFAIVMQTFLVLDGFVFNLYRFHINAFVINLALYAGKEEFVFDIKLYLMFAAFILFTVVLPYLLIFWMGKKWKSQRRKNQIITICIVLFVCMLFSHVAHAVAAAVRQTSIQKSATVLPYFFPLTMNRLLDNLGITSQDEIDRLDYDVPTSDLAYPVYPIVTGDSIPNWNILFIVIDSWNPRTFDSITTPNIYRMAMENHYFANHNSASFGTRENIFSLFFGLSFTYETEFIVTKKSPLLVDQLVHRDYALQVFPSAPLPSPPFHEILFRKAPHVNYRTDGNTPFERDQKITRLAIDFMNEQKDRKPFFSFLFYDLPHAMSMPKEISLAKFQPSWTEVNYMALNNNMDPEPFFNFYRNLVYQVDKQVGILLEYVQNSGLMDNTVVIITGDHGQEFNENRKNYWGHGSNFSRWQLHVPLIVYYPGLEPRKQFPHMTTHYDIAPTLMQRYLGVENPTTDYSMGYELCDTTNRFPHVVGDHVNYGFVFEDIIVRTDHLGRMTVTDKSMNDLPRNAVNIKELQKGIEKKNMFYK